MCVSNLLKKKDFLNLLQSLTNKEPMIGNFTTVDFLVEVESRCTKYRDEIPYRQKSDPYIEPLRQCFPRPTGGNFIVKDGNLKIGLDTR